MSEPPTTDVGRALHCIGHEMRNGLNALQVNNHLLLQTEPDDPQREILMHNAAAIRDLADLVDIAVYLGDLRTDRLRLAVAAEPLHQLVDEVADTLRDVVAGRMVEAAVETTGGDDDCRVDTDRAALGWLLRALARSGFVAGEAAGVIRVQARVADSAAQLVLSRGAKLTLRPGLGLEPGVDWPTPLRRADLELAIARRVADGLGIRLEPQADAAPPAWVAALPISS